jgi:hypothetical protein
MKVTNEQIYLTLEALLKALCPFEEFDTPEISAAVNIGMRTRDAVRDLIQENATKG